MILILQTEEENKAFGAAIGAIMEKGEEINTVDELSFLEMVVPIVEAHEKLLYGEPRVCLKCAADERRREDEAKVALAKELADVGQTHR